MVYLSRKPHKARGGDSQHLGAIGLPLHPGEGAFFLYRLDPHAGHASLTTIAAVDLPDFRMVFDQQ